MRSTSAQSNQKRVTKPSTAHSAKESFPIVVVGASAGGTKAFSELLSALPGLTGMAFIYAQYHTPCSANELMEQLSCNTKMKIRELGNLDDILPNHLYVTVLNEDDGNKMSDDKLNHYKQNKEALSINSLFITLAQTFKKRIIGIVLSGDADDGVSGIQNIKKLGGLTFAQNNSAKFTNLPHSSIATGVIDHIMAPKDIAIKLSGLDQSVLDKSKKMQLDTEKGDTLLDFRDSDETATSVFLLKEEKKKGEARYRELLFGLPIAVYTCNADGYIELYNEAAVQLWGTKPIIGKDLWCGSWKIYKQDGTPLPLEDCPMALALKNKRPISFEIIIERPDGTRRHIIPNPQPTFDSSGALSGAINTLIDITPQVEARKKSEATEIQFSTLANNIQNLAWMANADGWIFWYNQRWYDYTGTTKEEMEGWGWQSVHDPRHLPTVLKGWKGAIETGQPFEMTFPIKGADGKFRSFLTRIFPIHDTEGKVVRWVGTNTDIHEQKRHSDFLEANLKEVDEQMQAILQFAPDAVVTIDEKGIIISWNPEAEQIFGWSKEEVLGKSLTETIIPERYAQRHTKGMEHFIKTGEGPAINKPIEMFAVKKNKIEIPIELKISTTKINDSYIFIGFLRDISIRKQAQETIKNKTAQLIEAQQLAHIGSWEWDVTSDKIEWSDEMYRIFELRPQEFEPSYESYLGYIHGDDREYVNTMVQQAFSDHQSFNFIHRITCADGTVKFVSATGKVFINDKGETIRMAGTAQDVTEQQKHEAALKDSEERFFKIFDSNPVPMSLSEIKTNKIRYVNALFCTVFGYSKEEIIGKTSEELQLIGPKEYERVIAYIFGYLQEKRSLEEVQALSIDETEQLLMRLKQTDAMRDFEVQYTRKSGETFPAIVSFEIIRLNSERFTVTSYHDISERKRGEELLKDQNEQLEKMNKELQSFTYISSHDLQEPLRKIQTFAGHIVDTELENLSEKGKDYFSRMHNAADRMQTLIQDLLALSHANTLKGKFELTKLNEIVESVIADFAEAIEREGAIIDVQNLGQATLIPFQFHQLFHNLLSNSFKFSKSGQPPRVDITSKQIRGDTLSLDAIRPSETYLHIAFKDYGIGFKEEFTEKIFEVFQRLHAKDEYPGTGIGLAIVKKIVDNHNGFITATSELGKGTTFNIYIPTSS